MLRGAAAIENHHKGDRHLCGGFLGGGEGFGEAGARLRVGLLVDGAQVPLHHTHRDAELLGDLLERALVLGNGYQHVDFARGESVVGDEGLACSSMLGAASASSASC